MRKTRERGFSLLEVSSAITICVILFGTVGVIFNKLLDGIIDVRQETQAMVENNDGIQSTVDELVTSNALGSDLSGEPFLDIISSGSQMKIRQPSGYTIDSASDIVNIQYGSPVEIYVDSNDRLIRKKGTVEHVLARNIKNVAFDRNAAGNIVMRLKSYRGKEGEPDYKVFDREITLTPRNGFDR